MNQRTNTRPLASVLVWTASVALGAGLWFLRRGASADIRRHDRQVSITRTAANASGAHAIGAFAIGALAIGRLAIRRLIVGRTRLREVDIEELRIGRLHVQELNLADRTNL